ncbi:MAG TPA: hypothetical protein VHG69_05620, partial [Thermoleophilaceae bacterium]|nr:hypothetical protein [Thermoleophilaceae bacterium]
MNSQRAWIVTAAVGWALAIFAGGVLLGMELGDDETGSESASSNESGGSAGTRPQDAVVDDAVVGDPARGAPLRVSLRDVRGELAIGPEGSGSGRDSGRSRPGGGGPGGAVIVSRSGASGGRSGDVPASGHA